MENLTEPRKSDLVSNRICKGWVNHQRLSPKKHEFTYPVFMFYLNIDEISNSSDTNVSNQRWRIFKSWVWKRSDYFDGADIPLRESINHWLNGQGYPTSFGPMTMLTNVRCFGYIINPISVYFLFDASGENIEYMIAEVTNTPWRERKKYLIPCRNSEQVKKYTFDKEMHVSPFHDMNIKYNWRSHLTDQQIVISIDCSKLGTTLFSATLSLNREGMSVVGLKKTLIQYPFMTARVAWGIYWQAIKLFIKRIPIFPHPKSVK